MMHTKSFIATRVSCCRVAGRSRGHLRLDLPALQLPPGPKLVQLAAVAGSSLQLRGPVIPQALGLTKTPMAVRHLSRSRRGSSISSFNRCMGRGHRPPHLPVMVLLSKQRPSGKLTRRLH